MVPPGRHIPTHQPCRYYEPTEAILLRHVSACVLGHVAGAAEHFAGQRARHFAMVDNGHAVDEYVFHSLRQLVGILEGGEVMNFCRIEYDHVGPQTGLQHAAVRQAHALGGQCSEFADSVFEGELAFFTNVLVENARERAVSAWMRMFLSEDTLGRSAGGVVIDGDPGLLESEGHVRLGHAEDGHGSEGMVFDQEVEESVHRVLVPNFCYFG